uniref:Uncharacterized protein n=1 Tax=Panagrolaimus superbus TaxID=310955 RepID=A0A914YVV3_9BILA
MLYEGGPNVVVEISSFMVVEVVMSIDDVVDVVIDEILDVGIDGRVVEVGKARAGSSQTNGFSSKQSVVYL